MFSQWAKAHHGWIATVTDAPLAEIGVMEPHPDLVVANGLQPVEFTAAQTESIRAYVERGGTILFETPGGQDGFADAAEKAMQDAFGTPAKLMTEQPILTGQGINGADDVRTVEYRPYLLQALGARDVAPRLRGIVVDGRPAMLFSREDISFGLLNRPRWGISGYSTASARALMANICAAASKSQVTSDSRSE